MTTVDQTEGAAIETAAATSAVIDATGIPAATSAVGKLRYRLIGWLTRRYTYEERWQDPLHILVMSASCLLGLAAVVGYVLMLMAGGYFGAGFRNMVMP